MVEGKDSTKSILIALVSISKVGDLSVYVVGSGPKTIIWNHDIFGWDSGRTRYWHLKLYKCRMMLSDC